jgi:transcriptional regulator with XRE-family HTH domain
MNYLGKYLKKKLKELKVSEREISAKCGISHSYLNQLIKGVNPSTKKNISPTLTTFEKLSNGLGVSVDFLQKIARGIIHEENEFFVADKLFYSENKNISPDLLTQIHDFQNFISIIGLDNKTRSENEWTELIYELKSVIGKHMQERE